MVTRLPQADQDFINEVITNNVEKLQWDPVEIARHLKVKTGTFAHNENNKLKYYLLLKIKIVTFSQIELDKKLGCIWHAIVGEEFGYEITYEVGIVILVESFFIITDIIGLYDLCVLRKLSNSSVEVWNSADVRD